MKLPHWLALVALILGGSALGCAAQFPAYSTLLTIVGGVLVASGQAGALVLPSVFPKVQIAAVAKLPDAVPRVQAEVLRQSNPPPKGP
jgi:hypothetical protein